MLIQLMPKQISEHWEPLEFAINESLPPLVGEVQDKMSNILMALLDGRMQAWVSCVAGDNGVVISGFVFTQVLEDPASRIKSLLIYCLYGYENVNEKEWIDGLRTLKKFSAAVGCRRVIAYTDIPYVMELAKRLGGEAKYTFIVF